MAFETSVYNINPYYDDFNASNQFLRVLFRPGFSVQARELTQLQTILQNQIKVFGEHVFEPGSLVSGGQITESTIYYARIVDGTMSVSTDNGSSYSTVDSDDVSSVLSRIIGAEFGIGNGMYNNGNGRILSTLQKNDSSVDVYHYIYFDYLSGSSTLSAEDIIELVVDDGTRYRFEVKPSSPTNLPAVGNARLVTTQPGIYFIDGAFVLTTEQNTVPYNIATSTNNTDGSTTIATGGKMFETPTARVGFVVTDAIITSDDDSTLLDPANGSPNFSAPGADRLKKSLELSFQAFTDGTTVIENYASTGFVEVLRYESGVVTKREIFPDYAVLEETLARRTKDESGNYTLQNFSVEIKENTDVDSPGDETKLSAVIDPGKAYISGYEFETISRTFLDFTKSRDFDTISDKITDSTIGNYVIVGASVGTTNGLGDGSFVLDSQNHPEIYIGNSAGATFGSARFKQFDIESVANQEYRLYLYDITLQENQDFGDATFFFASSGETIGIISTTSGIDASTNAIQYLSTRDSLVVELPVNSSIKTVNNADYSTQLSFEQSASGNQIQVSVPSKSGDPITFPGDVNDVVASSLLNNRYFLFDLNQNKIIDDFSSITFTTSNDNETVTVAGLTNGTSYRLLSNCVVNTTNSSFFMRSKVLGSTETINSIPLAKDAFLGVTYGDLGVADVYMLESVIGESASPGTDFTSRFYLDDGQRDNLYDHARIVLKSGLTAGDTLFTVNLRRFTHTGDGPFVVDSYPVGTVYSGVTFGYENIPSFRSNKTGKTVSLRDVLDFRPVKDDNGDITNAYIPVAKQSVFSSFEHYLSRVDKIVITKDQEFKVIPGIPSLNPTPPFTDPESLTLFTMRLGPWTFGPDDVEVQHNDTRRFTMEDIGQIEKRVGNLEYFSSLSSLENEANSRTFVTSSNVIIPKVGIVVDNFDGHELGDVNDKDYNCSMDFESGELRPAFKTRNVSLVRDTSTSIVNSKAHTPSSAQSGDVKNDLYTLDYTIERSVANPLADSIEDVNPTGRIDWYGYMEITPWSDDWFYESSRPVVRSNKYGVNDAWQYRSGSQDDSAYGFGTQWNDWEYNWFGREKTNFGLGVQDLLYQDTVFDETFGGTTTGVRTKNHEFLFQNQINSAATASDARKSINKNVTPDTILKSENQVIVNDSINPYNRGIVVSYNITGMKPSETVYLFVDNVSKGSVSTDSTGSIEGTIVLDSGEVKSGEILLRAIDSSTNTLSSATTVAEALFRVSGVGSSVDPLIISTRPTIKRRASVTDSNIIPSTLTRNLTEGSGIVSLDNMAQNFSVDRNKYPKGMFVKSLDLMFSAAPDSDDEKDIPVTIEIRPTVSGYPHPSKIVPGSVVSLSKADINVATTTDFETTANKTTFEFNYPVYLVPGEYSIIVKSNSNKYKVYTSALGNSISTLERITQQPNVGNFFKPQNAGTYISEDLQRLSFSLNRCKFTTSTGTLVFRNLSGEYIDNFTFDKYFIHSGDLDLGRFGTNSQLSYQIQTTDENGSLSSTPTDVAVNQTITPLDSRGTQIVKSTERNIVLTATLITDDDAISPVIDLQRLSFLGIQNSVNTSSSTNSTRADPEYNGELDPIILDTVSPTKVSKSRYITKSILLGEGVSATNMRVILDINQQSGTDIQVFVKTLGQSDVNDFDSQNYIELSADTTVTSESDDSYTEVVYSPASASTLGNFNAFVVKIVMHTSDQFTVPKAKDMRVIALA